MCVFVCVHIDHSQTACRDLAQRYVWTELLVSSGGPAHSVAAGRSHTARTHSQQKLQPKPTVTSVLGREVSDSVCSLVLNWEYYGKIANMALKWNLLPMYFFTSNSSYHFSAHFPLPLPLVLVQLHLPPAVFLSSQSVLPSGEHRRSFAAAAHQWVHGKTRTLYIQRCYARLVNLDEVF